MVGRAKQLEINDINEFKKKIKSSYIDNKDIVVHIPYLPNFAAPTGESYLKSKELLAEEIIRCFLLDIPYLILHLGSHLRIGGKKWD